MAYGGYDYEFIDPLPDECPCAVCTLVQKEPYQVTCCGKIFCKSCLDQLILKNNKCPICRSKTLNDKNSFPDLNTERKIKHFKIYCVNKNNGCKWTGHLKDLEQAHIQKCPNQLVTCTNTYTYYGLLGSKCEARVQRRQLEKHMKMECEYRVVECTHCGTRASYSFITGEHTKKCPAMKVPCSNRGCNEQVERRLLEQHEKTCPKSIIPCRYSSGCKAQITRDGVKTHNQEHMEEHLVMAKLENVTVHLKDLDTQKFKETEKKMKPAKMGSKWTGHLQDLDTHRNEYRIRSVTSTKTSVTSKLDDDEVFVIIIICWGFVVLVLCYVRYIN